MRRQELRSRTVGLVLASLGGALALRGQHWLSARSHPSDGALLLLVGAAFFAYGCRRVSLPDAPDAAVEAPGGQQGERRYYLGLACVVAAVLTFHFSGGNRFCAAGVAAWAASVVLFLAVAAPWRQALAALRQRLSAAASSPRFGVGREGAALLLIVALAAFLRFHQLGDIPSDMYADQAENYVDILDVRQGQYMIFSPRNTGREMGLQYLTAVYSAFFGLGFYGQKAVTALIGVAAVPAMYLLGRELYGGGVGLLSALLTAIGKWPITISRLGLRGAFVPLTLALLFYFLARAVKYNRRSDWLLAGAVMGLGMYTYMSLRGSPLLLVLFVGATTLRDRAFLRKAWKGALSCLGLAFLLYLPLFRYMVDFPRQYWMRTLTRLTEQERELPGEPLELLWGNIKNSLLMFNWRGDSVMRLNVPNEPFFDWVSAALLVMGAAWLLLRWRRGLHVHLLGSAALLFAPSTLSLAFPAENPNAFRSASVLPLALLVAALPLELYLRSVRQLVGGRALRWTVVIAVPLLVTALVSNYRSYFTDYAYWYNPHHYPLFRAVARVIAHHPQPFDAYLVGYPHFVDGKSVIYQTGVEGWHNIVTDPTQSSDPRRPLDSTTLYVLSPLDEENLGKLLEYDPQAIVHRYYFPEGDAAFVTAEVHPDAPGPWP